MLQGKSLGRKQTLTYLKGYQHESADLGAQMSAEGAAKGTGTYVPANYGSPKAGTLIGTTGSYGSPKAGITGTYGSPSAGSGSYGSPKTGTATQRGSGSPLPKWVEENGRVSHAVRPLGRFQHHAIVTQHNSCTALLADLHRGSFRWQIPRQHALAKSGGVASACRLH